MKIALTGGTGFLGRYIVDVLSSEGHTLRAWYCPGSEGKRFGDLDWIPGELGNGDSCSKLVEGCEALVHAALWREGDDWSPSSNLSTLRAFLEKNIVGSVELFELARQSGVEKCVFISTCAVHTKILPDRPLNELHPLYPSSHYGAHKAAIEAFVHSFALGLDFDICSLRPTGIYGLAHPASESKWYELVKAVAAGKPVTCDRGGKEVHARDVAKAVAVLLRASHTKGEVYNCYDRYVSDWEVAQIAKRLSGSRAEVSGKETAPKNQIDSSKLKEIGMTFGGAALLESTVRELLQAV